MKDLREDKSNLGPVRCGLVLNNAATPGKVVGGLSSSCGGGGYFVNPFFFFVLPHLQHGPPYSAMQPFPFHIIAIYPISFLVYVPHSVHINAHYTYPSCVSRNAPRTSTSVCHRYLLTLLLLGDTQASIKSIPMGLPIHFLKHMDGLDVQL